MTNKKATKKNAISTTKLVAVGVGVAALGAGAYYFLGPDGKKHQKKAMGLISKIKKETLKDIKKAKPIIREAKKTIDLVKKETTRDVKHTKPIIKQANKTIKLVKKTTTKKKAKK